MVQRNRKDQGFQSSRAIVETKFLASNTYIYGATKIGIKTIIDSFVIIGYPSRVKIKEIVSKEQGMQLEHLYDQISAGSTIGKGCHIRPNTVIYENSILENNVETGTNVLIRENCMIGESSIVGSGTILDSNVIIGKNARIQSNNFIPPKIQIGNNVFLGPGVKFANDSYPVSKKLVSTHVGNDVIIGMGAIIMPGISIEDSSVVAAGSIVTKSIKTRGVVLGTPAKYIMSREDYELKQKNYEESEE